MAAPVEQLSPAAGSPFDLETASSFLREQADCLAAGLEHGDDPLAVRAVLRSHDGSHDMWLRVIAAVTSRDAESGNVLGGLYAFHGRVAGSLERAPGTGDRTLHRDVREVLRSRLRTRTVAALATLAQVLGTGPTLGEALPPCDDTSEASRDHTPRPER